MILNAAIVFREMLSLFNLLYYLINIYFIIISVAERVVSRGEIVFDKYTLRVSLFTGSISDDIMANAVVLTGDDIPTHRVKLFMENPKRINGGQVKDVYKDKQTNDITVEFQNAEGNTYRRIYS